MSNDKDDSQSSFVELVKACWHLLAWDHVVLEEGKQVYDQLLELEPLLIEGIILNESIWSLCLVSSRRSSTSVWLLTWTLRLILKVSDKIVVLRIALDSQEEWHELVVRNKLKPGK